jgi:hypothetical protein
MAITRVGSATVGHSAASLNLVVPDIAGLAVGDLAIFFASTNGATHAAQNGWQLLENHPFGTGHGFNCLYKVLTQADVDATSFTFAASASNVMQGGIIAFRGVDPLDPIPSLWWASADEGSTADTSIDAPSVTTTVDGAMVVRAFTYFFGTGTTDGNAITASPTKEFEVAAGGALNKRPLALFYEAQATFGPTGAVTATQDTSGVHAAFTIALKPVAAPTAETLRPTGVSGLSNLTGAHTDIDQDPDGAITDAGLVGTDPSGQSGLTDGPERPNNRTLWSGSAAHTWTSPGLAFDADAATFASYALAANTTDYTDWWSFETGQFDNIPSNATITAVGIETKWRAGTANRLSAWVQLSTANGTLLGTEQAVNAGATIPVTAGGVVYNNTHSGTMPTVAQLQSDTFGVRTRISRSNTVTAELYDVRLTITYSTPGSTVNTQADVALANPIGALATGAATGEIRGRISKTGTGSNPQGRIEVRNAAGTLLGTAIADTTITESDPDGQIVSGTFNQSIILDPSGADVVLRFVGTGASGGLARLIAVEWNAQILDVSLAGKSAAISYNVAALATKTGQLRFDLYTRASATRAVLYNLAALASKSGLLRYDVIGQATKTGQLRFDVSGLATKTGQLRFDLYSRASKSGTIGYELRGLAAKNGQLRFDISALASRSGQLRFDLYTLAQAIRQIRYDIEVQAGMAGKQAQLLYDVLAFATQQRELRFDLYERATKNATSIWDVFSLAGAERDTLYEARALAGRSGAVRYDLSERAGRSGVLLYTVHTLSGGQRELLFDVAGYASLSGVIGYDLYARAGRAGALRFDLRGRAGSGRTILYDLAANAILAGRAAQLLYDLYALSTQQRQIRYDIYGRAGGDRDLMFDVRGLVSGGRETLYNVYALVSRGQVVRFDVGTLTGSERTFHYDVHGLVSKNGVVLYKVDQIGAELLLLLEGKVIPATELGVVVSSLIEMQPGIIIPTEIDTEVHPA